MKKKQIRIFISFSDSIPFCFLRVISFFLSFFSNKHSIILIVKKKQNKTKNWKKNNKNRITPIDACQICVGDSRRRGDQTRRRIHSRRTLVRRDLPCSAAATVILRPFYMRRKIGFVQMRGHRRIRPFEKASTHRKEKQRCVGLHGSASQVSIRRSRICRPTPSQRNPVAGTTRQTFATPPCLF